MKNQSKTTTVYRTNLEKGNYTTISRNILISNELTDSAKTLLQLCLNNTSEWNLVLSHYQKLLKWSNDKMSGAVSNLIEYGYLKKQKYPNGKGKGFTYNYTVSEFGNLNPNREKVTYEVVMELVNEEIDTQLEETEEDIAFETSEASTLTELEKTVMFEIIDKAMVGYYATETYYNKLFDYYTNMFKSEQLDVTKLNKEFHISAIIKSLERNKSEKLKIIGEWIDYHNNRGTKDQRINIKERALQFFNELGYPLDEVAQNDVSNKVLKLKMSIVDANRKYDSRYQD